MKATRLIYSKQLLCIKKKWKEKTENKDDTGFPQMGEEGCGSLYPTRFLLTCYNDLKKWCFWSLKKRVKKAQKYLEKTREWRRGMAELSQDAPMSLKLQI